MLSIDFVQKRPDEREIVARFPGTSGFVYAVLRKTELDADASGDERIALSLEKPAAAEASLIRWTRLNDSTRLGWRQGNLFLEGPTTLSTDLQGVVVEFAFYEARLREMEEQVRVLGEFSLSDVAAAHRPRWSDRARWPRFQSTIEQAAALRLRYAQLEPHWEQGGATLSRDDQRLLGKLLRHAGAPERALALSERLESLEDLYEGANDRVAEHRWFLSGTLLEVAIVILLLVEAALMAVDVYIRVK